LKVRILQEALV